MTSLRSHPADPWISVFTSPLHTEGTFYRGQKAPFADPEPVHHGRWPGDTTRPPWLCLGPEPGAWKHRAGATALPWLCAVTTDAVTPASP